MKDLNNLKEDISGMAGLTLEMWQLTHRAFMEHDPDLISVVLEKEHKLNDLEKEITQGLVDLSKNSATKEGRVGITIYTDIVGDLELIGDYCKDILERVQIKIEEKLLFSDDAVSEYNDLYGRAELTLKKVVMAILKDNTFPLEGILKSKEDIEALVDEYRRRHDQRLIEGSCSVLACNMFLNMLDFTAAVYYHTEKIVRNLLKTKK